MITPDLRLRTASPCDAPLIRSLEEQAFSSDRLPLRAIRRLIKSPSAHVIVAEAPAHGIAGATVLLSRRKARVARLYSLAVTLSHRHRGVASRLIAAAEAEALKLGAARLKLEVRTDNEKAAQLYRRLGYTASGARPAYYEDGADAIVMEKVLT